MRELESCATRTSVVRWATIAALGLGLLVLAIRFHSSVCAFPDSVWNDVRVAAAVAMARGQTVYSAAGEGVINTWTYGPLPLVFLAPATLSDTPQGALLIAGLMNALLNLLPVAAVCFWWPVPGDAPRQLMPRALAFVGTMAVWPGTFLELYWSDTLATALSLLANLVLIRSPGKGRWLAATLATAAVACKPLAIAAPLAQVAWCAVTGGGRAAGLHALRCAVTGIVLAGFCILCFGFQPLWFTVVKLPGAFPWAPSVSERLAAYAPELLLQIGLPLVVMLLGWRRFRAPQLSLPALAWACALPLSVAGLLKVGGRMNSVSCLQLWLPPVLTVVLTTPLDVRKRHVLQFLAALAAAATASARVALQPTLVLRPDAAVYRQAMELARQYPGQIWFAQTPLVSLYSDRRYYHDEDGLYVQMSTKQPLSREHVQAHLPPQVRFIAFRADRTNWNLARRVLFHNPRSVEIGGWTIWSEGPPAPP